jgi:glycosyltransferase-like protein
MRSLRIALLTHSTNPRGGVAHAVELGDALTRRGHRVVVHAPDVTGRGFRRPTLCETCLIPAPPVSGGTTAMVHARVADYLRHFGLNPARFDIWHAQDGISGNALATLAAAGSIPGFVRTVHHLDDFADPELAALQRRSVTAARTLLVVSRRWQHRLRADFGRAAAIVGNGVDTDRFTPTADARDAALRAHLGLVGAAPTFLAIGGVGARKNTLAILAAFIRLHAARPDARLVIAGGASLLDHTTYQARFAAALAESGLPDGAVTLTGSVAHDTMPALYRLADALVFPSLNEGFGLVVLEAMASGVPVIAPRIAPFTDYLDADDVLWCDPQSPPAIADAMRAALAPAVRSRLAAHGPSRAVAFGWDRVARAHLDIYANTMATANA